MIWKNLGSILALKFKVLVSYKLKMNLFSSFGAKIQNDFFFYLERKKGVGVQFSLHYVGLNCVIVLCKCIG